jgi:DNA replication and repair protein RecF
MIKKIKLNNFRNFKSKEVEFSDGITLIQGQNASGKTNILESLYLLSTGKSFKARVEEEMVNHDKDICRVSGIALNQNSEETNLEIMITRGLIDIGGERPEKAPRKKLQVNGIPRRMIDFAGNFRTVLFGPWDLDLVTESPSIRRKFLDNVLSQVDREYRRSILSYEKGLRQRNRILWDMREGNVGRDRLLFWNQLLIKNGNYITDKREEFINFINELKFEINGLKLSISYDKSIISEGRLEHYKNEEVASATTLVGPHRDDFVFYKGERNLSSFGSRGEQRMGVLWLKMAELSFIEAGSGERPTLLLDDIFSELDDEHKKVVMEVAQKQQTIITSVDDEFGKGLKKTTKIDLMS